MISNLLSYYYHRFSGTEFIDFVDQGLGIKARYARSRRQWQPHLQCSQNFISHSISEYYSGRQSDPKSISVLGAGRLLDFPQKSVSENFNRIYFIDADPSCLATWKKFRRNSKAAVNWEINDISGRLKAWTLAVSKHINRIKLNTTEQFESSLALFLESLLTADLSPFISILPKSNLVVSLNLLSQLGIYWRDRVLALISKYQPTVFLDIQNSSTHSPIETALLQMSEFLESEHIKMLEESGAEMLILLYDDEFYYYRSETSHWQIEKALALKEVPQFAGYQEVNSSSWLWHIVPQGKEQRSFGEIHRVQARLFSLKAG